MQYRKNAEQFCKNKNKLHGSHACVSPLRKCSRNPVVKFSMEYWIRPKHVPVVELFIQILTTGRVFQNQSDQRDVTHGSSFLLWVSQWHKEDCVRDVKPPGTIRLFI
jgi:hypothetical protein